MLGLNVFGRIQLVKILPKSFFARIYQLGPDIFENKSKNIQKKSSEKSGNYIINNINAKRVWIIGLGRF